MERRRSSGLGVNSWRPSKQKRRGRTLDISGTNRDDDNDDDDDDDDNDIRLFEC